MKIAKTVFFICHIEIYYFCVQKLYNLKKKKFKPSTTRKIVLGKHTRAKKIMQGLPLPLTSTLTVRR